MLRPNTTLIQRDVLIKARHVYETGVRTLKIQMN